MLRPHLSLHAMALVLMASLAAAQVPQVRERVPITPAVAPASQPPPLTKSLETLDGLLTGYLQSMPPDRDDPSRPGAARALGAVSRLRALSGKWPAESPLDYRVNVDREVRNLQTVLESPKPRQMAAIVTALADDLEAKLEHCVKSGGRLGGSVTVRVRTVRGGGRGGEEVRNWQVFYLPRVLDLVGGAVADRFPQLSSPTDERLVPGRYVMWSSDPASGRLGEKTIVKVGEGRQDLTIDLTVPAS